jgi:hypothetical protein
MAGRRRLTPSPLGPTPTGGPGSAPRPPIAAAAGAEAAEAALREVTEAMVSARAEGRLIEALPLTEIRADHLHRDRILGEAPDEEMQALVESIRDRGQQVPIDVVRLETGFGLVAGLRRLTALRRLHGETGEDRFATVRARVVAPGDMAEAYRAMVEENEIRIGVSFWERGRVVVKAVEAGVHPDIPSALKGLYGGVSRAKRSKIGTFARLVERLGDVLRFPDTLSEHRGLALAKRLDREPWLVDALGAALEEADPQDDEAEQAAIARILAPAAGVSHAKRVRPEVTLTERDGALVLSGPGLTPQFKAALRRWIDSR